MKTLDKLTNKELLPTYPFVDWKKVMGARDIMAHHYFEVDADEVFSIVKNDLEPLKKAIDYFVFLHRVLRSTDILERKSDGFAIICFALSGKYKIWQVL